jgi:hypothetical protein
VTSVAAFFHTAVGLGEMGKMGARTQPLAVGFRAESE